MKFFRPLFLALLAVPALAQNVAVPPLNLSGAIGCIGFPCSNVGTVPMPADADYNVPSTMSQPYTSGTSIKVTSAVALTATRLLKYPIGRFVVDVENATTGGQSIQVIGASGTGVTIPNGQTVRVWNDGTNFVQVGSGSGGGATIAHTFNVIAGDNAGNGVATGIGYTSSGTTHGVTFPASSTPIVSPSGSGSYGTDASGNAVISNNADTTRPIATVDCPINNATNICLTHAPYYASGSALYSTTNAGSGSTTITITSCASGSLGSGAAGFDAASAGGGYGHQGVDIVGAGVSGADYIGTVTSCVGSTMVVTPATSTTVTGAIVKHDDTAAFNAAITALGVACSTPIQCGTGGHIWLPDGLYRVNGALQDTSNANAVILMPQIQNYSAPTNPYFDLEIAGFQDANNNSALGAIIQSELNLGNLFGGKDPTGGPYPPFTNVELILRNLSIHTGQCAVAVNGTSILAVTTENVLITSGTSVPSCTTGVGLAMPAIANAYQNHIRNTTIAGYSTNAILTEHTHVESLYLELGINGALFDNGTSGGSLGAYNGNSIAVDYMWMFQNTNALVGGSNITVMNVQNADFEQNVTDIRDSGNVLRGKIDYLCPYGTGGPGGCVDHSTLNIVGGTNLTIKALYDGVCVGPGCGGGGTISGLTAGYIPLAGSPTSITANSHINDGVTTASILTATEPVNVTLAGSGSISALSLTAPSLGANNVISVAIGKAQTAHNSAFQLWENTAVPFYSIQTFASGDPVQISANATFLDGGPVCIGCNFTGASLPTLNTGLTTPNVTDSGLTSTFLPVAGSGGLLGNSHIADSSGTLTFTENVVSSNIIQGANLTAGVLNTVNNCSSSASPAVCGSAAAGSVVIAAASTTVTVNTTAVGANSQILLTGDDSLGTKLGVTCNSTLSTALAGVGVTARSAGTSFTITTLGTVAVNPMCLSYLIVN